MTANSQVTDRYSGYAIGLHWATAALIVALFFVGWRMVALPISPAKFELYALHKSLGVVVLAVTVWRLAVRLLRPAPDAIDGPAWQMHAAAASHALLYALLVALPISGWLFNSVVGFPLSLFGMVELPNLVTARPALKEVVRLGHVWLGWGLLPLLSLHIVAALQHHFLRHDRTLIRMLPHISLWTRRPR